MPSDPNVTSGVLKFQELLIQEMRSNHRDLVARVDEYHAEAAVMNSKMDLHIATCDLRRQKWERTQDTTPRATPMVSSIEAESALFSKKRIFRKMFDGIAEHAGLIVVLTIIQMALFAWNHGFRPSIPDVTPSTKTAP